jgi:hypothetical protein
MKPPQKCCAQRFLHGHGATTFVDGLFFSVELLVDGQQATSVYSVVLARAMAAWAPAFVPEGV